MDLDELAKKYGGSQIQPGASNLDDLAKKYGGARLEVPQPKPAPVKEAGFSLRDLAASFGMGATGGTKAITEAFGADNVAAQKLEQASQFLQSTMTPERQAELARQQQRMKEAEKEGTLAEIKAGLKNIAEAPLQSTAQALGSFVPYLPAMFAAPAARAIGLLPKAYSAVVAVAEAAPAVIGTAQGAGAVKGSIYDGVLRAEMEAGTPEAQARDKAAKAQEYFGKNFEQIALGAGLGYGAARFGAERLLTPKGREGLAPGLAKRVGVTSAGEAGTEAAQAAQERIAQNIAQQREGFDVPTFQGVAGAATQEGIMGALGGAPVAAISRPTPVTKPPVPTEPPAIQPPAPPVEPTRAQTVIDEITGVTRPAAAEPMSLEEARLARARKAREDVEAAFEAEEERARKFGPRPTVPTPPLLDRSRPGLDETILYETTIRDKLLEKQRQVDERRLAAGLPTSTGVMPEAKGPEKPTEAPIVDNRPLTERAAKNRLLVMKNMLKNEGGDPDSLQIVPHPTVPERFAIASQDRPTTFTPGLPGTAATREPTEPIIDPVEAYVNQARATNTPAAIRFVRDYEQGLITRADVEQALEAERKAGRPLPFTYTPTGEPGIVAPGGLKARAPATATQLELKDISDKNGDFAVDSVPDEGGRKYVVSATPTLDLDKRLPLTLTSAEQAAADAIQARIDQSTTPEEGVEAKNLLKNTLRRALARNLMDINPQKFVPPTGEDLPPPVEPPPVEPPPTEPPPPTVAPPQTVEELKQRLPVLRQNKEVEAANVAGNFGALIDALEKSSNPIIQKIGQLSQKIRNKITLKKSTRRLAGYPNAAGLYNSGTDTIIMRSDYAGDEHTSAHEVVHALTVKAMLAPNARQRPIVKEIEDLYQHVKKELAKQGMGWDKGGVPRKYSRQVYGTADPFEFVSEANTNPEFQFLLMKIPYKGKRSAWTQFTRLVANLLGISDVNALTEIINLTDKLTAIPGRGSMFNRGKGDIYASRSAHKKFFDRAEKIPMSPMVESIRDSWIGGVSGIGDRTGAYYLYAADGGKEYTKNVQDFIRSNLGENFKGYRLMSNEELEEIKSGAMGTEFASFSLNPDVAKAFKSIPRYKNRKDLVVVEMNLTPEHVQMIGHPGEQELVIDYGQGYNPDEVNVFDKFDRGEIFESVGREISPIGFYSALSDAVSKVDTKAAPPAGWKTMLQGMVNKGVVKQNELEWTGINDWLDLQQGRVTKDQVKEYLDANGVQVEETVLGEGAPDIEEFLTINDMRVEPEGDARWFIESPTGSVTVERSRAETEDAAKAFGVRYFNSQINERNRERRAKAKESKYGQYTLPGGENYREVLLTLPTKVDAETERLLDEERYLVLTPEQQAKVDAAKNKADIKYRSSHWNKPNVLAHIRVNDRVDADGNRVLFVEEIQSDWGQEGKKKGFSPKNIDAQIKESDGRVRQLGQKIRGISNRMAALTDNELDEFNKLADERQRLLDERGAERDRSNKLADSKRGAPIAPFVGKTEGWLNLALKRIMVMAAQEGYDKVAFVNGEQSAERYDLSKQVDRIKYAKNSDGTYDMSIRLKGEQRDMVSFNDRSLVDLSESDVEEMVGKEIAQKIVAGEGQKGGDNFRTLEGLDLKVGGEGMKTFYDKIVPTTLKKLLPKVGGGQMGTVKIEGDGKFDMVLDNGETRTFDSKDSAYAWMAQSGMGGELRPTYKLDQPGFEITSEMRDKVDEGIELFNVEQPTSQEVQAAITKAEGTPAEQTRAILNQTGMQPQPPEQDRVKKILESLRSMGENPQLTKESARATLKQWTDKLETMAFSGDAAFNNNIRRNLIADLNENPEIMGLLLEASQSQAVHADALATQFIVEGGIAYDEEAKKWVAVKKEDNFIKLSKSIDALAAQYKIDKQEAERIAHTYFVAKRFKSLAEKQDQRDAEIAELEGKIDVVNSDIRRETDADKRDRLNAERDGYRKQIDDLKKAKVLISADQRAMIDPGMRLADIMPELKDISDIWQGIRTNAVKGLMDGQLWSSELAEAMLDNVDYVPFYRDEQLEEGGGPQEFIRGLQVKAEEYRLKGSNAPVHDVFDNMVRWTQYAINRSVRNHKALQMIDIGKEIQTGDQKMVTQVKKLEPGKNIVRVFRNGVQELYEVADPLYMDAFTSISNVAIPSIKFFSWFANMLRNSVVLYPLFSLAQVPQDAFSAMFTSGLKPRYALRIPILAVKEFLKTLNKTSATHNLLKKYGATGVRDFSAAVARQDVEIAAGLKPPKTKVGKGVELLSHIAMSADNAIRQAVYEASMQQGLSKAEAIEKAFDIINFRRRGSSKMINLMGQIVPFFYAYMSVQRVAMKTLSGVGISPGERKEALATLATMSGGLMAMSVLYAMLAADDEDYQDTPTAIRDRVLTIPGTGMRIPLRPDMFLMPKVIGEHAYHLITDNGLSDPKKARKSIADGLVNAMASPMPVPQAIKPALEVAINYDFFQGKPIVGYFEKQKEAERQFNESTSEFSKILGKAGVSPMMSDHVIRGMFGSVGGLFLYSTNFMLHSDMDVDRPAVSIRDMLAAVPGTGGFVAKSTENALKNDFYELRDEMAKTKATFNDIKTRSPQGIEDFINDEKNITRLGLAKTTEKVSDQLSKIRRAISQVSNAPNDLMSADEKQARIEELRAIEKDMLKSINVKQLRATAKL